MYERFYGFNEKPFDLTPDPRFIYFSDGHREALACLEYGIRERKGFVVIIGEIGSGKTTLTRTLLGRLDKNTKITCVTNPRLSIGQLLKLILIGLGDTNPPRDKVKLLLRLKELAYQQLLRKGNVVMVIDEAQELSPTLLNEIRMLANLQTDTAILVQVLMLGQPDLGEMLARPRLVPLRQRVSVRYYLEALKLEETREYVRHRLRIAGSNNTGVFTEEAIETIYRISRGIPRTINIVCDNALLLGYINGVQKIDQEIIGRATEKIM